ncbi:MAG: glutamate 5-kinase [Desulfobacterales bacterium]|nr:glutamate 5-kinase [Desulfobacterales bacterium]MDJ0873899.1 glutamate 5-kinase [Desulfobacterales bacterium]MDJ0884260.1 glutamate 5-kinase [Desulfobacterales bacterium]
MPENLKSRNIRRIVVKVGSNVLTCAQGLNLPVIDALSKEIRQLENDGQEVILVSSGAMAAGVRKMAINKRPEAIPARQAVAAVGQAGLILTWEKALARYGKKVAQMLLTAEDMTSRKRYLNARNTLNTLLDWGVLPIINENDTIMVDEIRFGDNDNLAAVITLLMDADILINLTDIDGLYDRDPRTHADAELIPSIETIGREIERYAGDIPGALGTGGMLSKIKAARKVTAAGIPMIIANGKTDGVLAAIFRGQPRGTFFRPKTERLSSRKCWLAFSLKPKGVIRIDKGAARALTTGGKSLLPSGIVGVNGHFSVGDPVQFAGPDDQVLGNGLVNYSAGDIEKIKGLRTSEISSCLGEKPYDEVIHRDNLVLTSCTLN